MKKLTAEWIKKADEDWMVANKLLKSKPLLANPCCFHCQQAVEKYFKAYLQELGQPIPFTHDLDKLLDLLLPHDPMLTKLRRGLDRLTLAAVDYRYPGSNASARKAQAAHKLMEKVRRTIRFKLGLRKTP